MFFLSYRIGASEGSVAGDLPTVTHEFVALIAPFLNLSRDWSKYRPPTLVQLRHMIAESGNDISFDLNYAI
ncbi:hypothetical protein QCN27_19570 [Cereibacter sp. SYSU M97828]|nr:hypothetical protein [Cereibacter flavus]